MQEERKSLYEKVQGAQADTNSVVPTQKAGSEAPEAPKDPKEDHPAQSSASPSSAGAPTLDSPLTEQLVKLKAEQALLKELAGSFTISHGAPTETGASQSHGLSEGTQEPEVNHIEGSRHQDGHEDGYQEQRDLNMESVD